MRGLKDALHVAWALALAALIVAPALPADLQGPALKALVAQLRVFSVSQHWSMYAPDPVRGQAYIDLRARLPDGREEPLEEAEQAAAGWGTSWAWQRSRRDIWRAHAALHAKGNINRTWYAKGVCVREARRRGEPPEAILVDRVVRSFTPPDAVRRGAPDLGVVSRTPVLRIDCRLPEIRARIAADREDRSRGAGPA